MDDQTKATQRPRSWKRLVLVGLSIGVGIVLALVLVIAAYLRFSTRPTAPRTWGAIELPSVGIKTDLKTQWADGFLMYQFHASPFHATLAPDFAKIVRTDRLNIRFTVYLEDQAGFQLCSVELRYLTPEIDNQGILDALVANDKTAGCTRSEYVRASSWNVSYVFPQLIHEAKKEIQLSARSRRKRSRPTAQAKTIEGTDELTGYNFSNGHLETRSGHIFVINHQGERLTAIGWAAPDRLKFACKSKSNCLIENLGFLHDGETVHATMLR